MTEPVRTPSSPMMLAYAAARVAAPGSVVLYRVGEFYEVLLDDAELVSRALGIQLTRRRQKDGDDIPMCGIPASSAETAIRRLLAAGHKVAVSEPPSEPSRDRPLRLITVATSVDAEILAEGRANNLTVVFAEDRAAGFAWIDLSTGEAGTCMASLEGSGPAIARIAPSEILVARWPDGSAALALAIRASGASFSDLDRPALTPEQADAVLSRAYREGFRGLVQGFSPPRLRPLRHSSITSGLPWADCPRCFSLHGGRRWAIPWRSTGRL